MSRTPQPPSDPPAEIAGIQIGERVRSAGPVGIHEGTDALGLSVRVHLAREVDLGGAHAVTAFLDAVGRAARAQHPSLVPFTTGGRHGEFVYAVTKDAGARTVDELLGRGGALAVERAVSIAVEVAGALTALEEAGTRHGDLTPRRIQLPGRGQVAVRPPRVLPVALYPRKARYQAPEEARGERGDIRADLFVLGLVFVEMLSGRSPVAGGDAGTRELAAGRLPPIRDMAPSAPPHVAAVLRHLLAARAEDRYATAAEAYRALQAVAAGRAPPAPEAASAAPQGDDRPTTAPIPVDVVAAAREASAPRPSDAAQPAAPQPAGPPRAAAPRAAVSGPREPGRIYIEARLGEALLEIVQPTWIGWPSGALDVHAKPEPFDGAAFCVEPGADGDVLRAVSDVQVGGAIVATHELQHGDGIEAERVHARYERTARVALRAAATDPPARGRGARAVLVVSVLATIAVLSLALVRMAGIGKLENDADMALNRANQALQASRTEHAGQISGPAPVRAPERAAQVAYEEARALARSRPGEPDVGRHALEVVGRSHQGTAYGRLAQIEAEALAAPDDSHRGDAILDALLETVEAEAITGGLDDALIRLRNFADERRDTISAAIARRAAVRLAAEMDERIAADMERAQQAMAEGNLRVVMKVSERMLEYVPWSRRDAVVRVRAEATRRMDAALGGGGTTIGGPTPRDPDPTPPPNGDETAGPAKPPVEVPQPGDADAAREGQALAAFQAARKALSAGHDTEALGLFVAFLRDFKGTPTATAKDADVRARIVALAATPAGIELAFRGAVESRDRGRWRITYDFSDPDQLRDFRDVNAFEAPPRANWDLRTGRVGAKGSGAYVLDAEFESEFLTVEVEVVPERAHDLGVIYFEPGSQQRFYLFTLQNSFFKLGAGNGRADFREHAIALFGPDMWADTPAGEIGFVRKCGSEEPKIPPGQPTTIKCGKAEEGVWMRFPGGRTIRGSAYGDKKYEFTGLVPGVFIVNSAAAFGQIVVEGVPSPGWVKRHWEKVLADL